MSLGKQTGTFFVHETISLTDNSILCRLLNDTAVGPSTLGLDLCWIFRMLSLTFLCDSCLSEKFKGEKFGNLLRKL